MPTEKELWELEKRELPSYNLLAKLRLLITTASEATGMAIAATSGETRPAAAVGTAITLYRSESAILPATVLR